MLNVSTLTIFLYCLRKQRNRIALCEIVPCPVREITSQGERKPQTPFKQALHRVREGR